MNQGEQWYPIIFPLSSLYPICRINGLALLPDLEVQPGLLATAAVSCSGDNVGRADPFTHPAKQAMVVGIQRQPPLTVVDHHQ